MLTLGPQADFQPTPYRFDELTANTVADSTEAQLGSVRQLAGVVMAATVDPTYKDVFLGISQAMDAGGYEGEYARDQLLWGSVHPDESVRDASGQAYGKVQRHFGALFADKDMYKPIAAYLQVQNENKSPEPLDSERSILIEKIMAEFERNGQRLGEADRAEVQRLMEGITANCTTFNGNVQKNKAPLTLTKEQLQGLPESDLTRLQTPEGNYTVTTANYVQVMKQVHDRNTREQVWRAKNMVGMETNRPLVDQIVADRHQVANLLGYQSWADLRLKGSMAGSYEAVEAFYDSIEGPLLQRVADEIAPMQELLTADGFEGPIQAWDTDYYAERIRQEVYGINTAEIANYFSLENVLEGMFGITANMYGVEITELEATNTWHEDVRYFGIRDNATGRPLGTFYMDLFPRPDKTGTGATGVTYTLQLPSLLPSGERQQATSVYVTNIQKPPEGQPCLLLPDQVVTMFHEFGHVMHITLGHGPEAAILTGSQVPKDFGEAPSQLMEILPLLQEVLPQIGKHWQTGEQIPQDIVDKLIAARDITFGLKTIRNLQLGRFDFAIHGRTRLKDTNYIKKAEKEATKFSGTPYVDGVSWAMSLQHLFGNGYDGLYSAYTWGQVIGDNIRDYRQTNGIVETGMAFREKVLAPGGSKPPAETVQDFIGRPADDKQAFLRRLGQLPTAANA